MQDELESKWNYSMRWSPTLFLKIYLLEDISVTQDNAHLNIQSLPLENLGQLTEARYITAEDKTYRKKDLRQQGWQPPVLSAGKTYSR